MIIINGLTCLRLHYHKNSCRRIASRNESTSTSRDRLAHGFRRMWYTNCLSGVRTQREISLKNIFFRPKQKTHKNKPIFLVCYFLFLFQTAFHMSLTRNLNKFCAFSALVFFRFRFCCQRKHDYVKKRQYVLFVLDVHRN